MAFGSTAAFTIESWPQEEKWDYQRRVTVRETGFDGNDTATVSKPLDVGSYDVITIQVIGTVGDPLNSGMKIQLEGSNEYGFVAKGTEAWDDIGVAFPAASLTGSTFGTFASRGFKFIRVTVDTASGVGGDTFTLAINAKT